MCSYCPPGGGSSQARPTRNSKRGMAERGQESPNHPASLGLAVLDASTRRYRHRCASSVALLMDAIARGVEARETRQPPRWGDPSLPRGGNRTHGGEFHKAQCSEIQTGRSLKVERVFEVQTAKLLPSRPNKFCFVTANGRGLQVACFCSLNGLRPNQPCRVYSPPPPSPHPS